MVPKFNANIKFKLKFWWLKNMDIDLLNNNKVGNFNVPSDYTPNNILFDILSVKLLQKMFSLRYYFNDPTCNH
jgi:hypothetical protein